MNCRVYLCDSDDDDERDHDELVVTFDPPASALDRRVEETFERAKADSQIGKWLRGELP